MQTQNIIFLADMQSFYASVEKASDPDTKNYPLIVAGDPKKRSGIILAACPLAKKYGIKTAEPLHQAIAKCPNVIIKKPRMQQYINVSLHITSIMKRFTDLVEPYSIDEQFLDVTGSTALFGSATEMAQQLQHTILQETGVYARVGIGQNKMLAKLACDNFAKKNKSGIYTLRKKQLASSLWKLPTKNMFGVGRKMEAHFKRIGIHTIGDLAHYDVHKLRQKWGVNGEVLWQTANGIDYSPVTPHTHDTQKAIGHQMTLPRDYTTEAEIKVVMLELSEEVCRRSRVKQRMGSTVSVGCRGASFDFPTGFYRQQKLPYPTNDGKEVFAAAWQLFKHHWDREPVRSVGLTLSQLQDDQQYQLDLFRDMEKQKKLNHVMDAIKQKYGATAILHCSSLQESGQAIARSQKIGGHYK
ncbi:DNA polymerase IV [Longirhabdus pacifica]|uniref:DNA polymerase IV n=1 Tax=Longirhabdus pacifica TaxID=2305227 RepID=UPI001008B33F|nr:DNA polymerase IV [Longirhabdus pacifica]